MDGCSPTRQQHTVKGLFLAGTRVTDAGLTHLEGLTKLEALYCASGWWRLFRLRWFD